MATPVAPVMTVAGPPKLPLAPAPGAVKTTDTPGTGLPLASRTVAVMTVGKAVLIVELCGFPVVAEMLAGAPGLLVRLKLADPATLGVVAVTL